MMNNQGLEALAALASCVSVNGNNNNVDPNTESGGVNRRASVPGYAIDHSSNTSGTVAPSNTVDLTRVMQNAASLLQSSQGVASVTPQQWQQLLSAATSAVSTPASFAPPNLGMLNSIPQMNQGDQSALMALQQQVALYQRLMQNQGNTAAPNINSAPSPVSNNGVVDASRAMQLAFGSQPQNPFLQLAESVGVRQVVPVPVPQSSNEPLPGSSITRSTLNKTSTIGFNNSMPPPPSTPGPLTQSITLSNAVVASPTLASQLQAIAPQPNPSATGFEDNDSDDNLGDESGDKKQLKRAANRRSAQLSRKRKKQFIEELKEENDDLRRKEQILKSIPDLVVVFDSSGRLWFVSQSVNRFLDFSARELEGTSFWNRLCDDSVRLLKAAFMDSLAARCADSDTAPLGSGFWELRLVDRDGTQKIVTLNGVVHFAGDRPECVCSIRPQDDREDSKKKDVSRDTASASSLSNHKSLIRVKPQQSVVSNGSSDSLTSSRRRSGKGTDAVRISDSGNSSGSSDSGCSDDMNALAE